MSDIADILGNNRNIVLAKEITKKWETIKRSTIKKTIEWLKEDKTRIKGEIVLIISGSKYNQSNIITSEINKIISLILKYTTIKETSSILSKIYKLKKNLIYKTALKIKNNIKDD